MQGQMGSAQVPGIMCGKCQSIWTQNNDPGAKPGSYRSYRGTRKMVCPQCESVVSTFFRTGKLTHTCPGCQSEMTRCSVQMMGAKSAATTAQSR